MTPALIAERIAEELRAATCARAPTAPVTLESRFEENNPAQPSGDDLEDRMGSFLLDQLRPNQQALARAHIADLAKILTSPSRDEARRWAARRAGAEDAFSELLQARVQTLLRNNDVANAALLRALRTFDILATASHKRTLDWLEVVEQLGRPRTTSLRIGSGSQVAVLVGDPEER